MASHILIMMNVKFFKIYHYTNCIPCNHYITDLSGDDGYIQPIRARIVNQQLKMNQASSSSETISTQQQINALYALYQARYSKSMIHTLGDYKINMIYDKMMNTDKYMDLDDGLTPYIDGYNDHNKSFV